MTRDADGDIVGTVEVVTEHTDITRRAAKVAHANANAAALAADRADKAGDADAFAAAVDVALDWCVVELIARGQHPGAREVDADGTVIGCKADTRPEGLTLRFDR